MTNQPNDEKESVFLDPVEPRKKRDDAVKDDLTADDLRLQTETPHEHRDFIDTENSQTPPALLAPQPRRHCSGRPQKPKKKRTTKQKVLFVLLIVLLVIVGLLLVAVGTLVVLYHIGRAEMLPSDDVVLTAPQEVLQKPGVTVSDNGRLVTYNGKKYRFNTNRTNILCIGKDNKKTGEVSDIGEHGQADTIILLSIDTETGKMDALPISRDTITDVELYREDGSYHGMEKTQLCLSFAYGAEDAPSCENVVEAVTRLLYGIPVNTYFCIDLGAIPLLNDAVGGVTVNALSDFPNRHGELIKKGTTITLYGTDAEYYVRFRDTDLLDSNNDRMARQKQYLDAFFNTTMAATKKDLNVPLALFDKASANSTTTLNPSRITFLTTTLVNHNSTLGFHSIKGEIVEGDDGFAEFIVDETALYETILDIFYTQVV